jgi:hypothetical protein
MALKMISKRGWLLLSMLPLMCGWLFGVCSATPADEVPNGGMSISNDKYSLSIIDEKPVIGAPWLKAFIFEIVDKKAQKINQFVYGDLWSRIRSVKNLYLLENDRLVIHGKLKRADIISMLDLKQNELADGFWCYDPVLSPSKRFYVYEKFYPYHGLPATQTSVVLVYDMEKPPPENRVPVKDYTEWPKEQVGLPIYPGPYVKARAYVLLEQGEPEWQHYGVNSPFLWSEDENRVVFLSTHKKQLYIVRVELSDGIRKPKIFKKPIVVANFIKPSLSEKVRENEAKILYAFSAIDIAWDGVDYIIVKPDKTYYALQEKIRLRVP